jgi:hypothetical protein
VEQKAEAQNSQVGWKRVSKHKRAPGNEKEERTGKGTILGKRETEPQEGKERTKKRGKGKGKARGKGEGKSKRERGREKQEGKGSALDEEMKQESIAGDRPRPAGGRGPDGVQQK